MKITLQIALAFFLAVNLGDANGQQNTALEIRSRCINESTLAGTTCYDNDKRIECLRKGKTQYPALSSNLQVYISDELNKKNVCSGLDDKYKCVESEIERCKNPLYGAMVDGMVEKACGVTNQARNCLVTFNKTCTADVIKDEIKHIDNIDNQCKAWNNGDANGNQNTALEIRNRCINESTLAGTTCYDNVKRIECLKKEKAKNQALSSKLQVYISNELHQKNKCSGLDDRFKCVDSEIKRCRAPFDKAVKDGMVNNVCSVINQVRNCLVTFNKTCIVDVIKDKIEEIDDVVSQCKAGTWNNGRCSKFAIEQCAPDVPYQDIITNGCTSADLQEIQKAKQCLTEKEKKCTTQYQQKIIESHSITDLELICNMGGI